MNWLKIKTRISPGNKIIENEKLIVCQFMIRPTFDFFKANQRNVSFLINFFVLQIIFNYEVRESWTKLGETNY